MWLSLGGEMGVLHWKFVRNLKSHKNETTKMSSLVQSLQKLTFYVVTITWYLQLECDLHAALCMYRY